MDQTSNTDREKKLADFWKEARDGHRIWRTEAVENYDFACGHQWKDADVALLDEEEKPHLTINHVLSIINLLSGMERQNKSDVIVYPRKGGIRIIAEAFTSLVKHAMDLCHGDTEQSMQFTDGIIAGKGWLKSDISYEEDPINGDVVVSRTSPFDNYEDPNANKYDLNESAKYIIQCYWGDKEQIKLLYYKYEDEIEKYTKSPQDEDTSDITGKIIKKADKEDTDATQFRYRLKEIWWKSYKKQLFFVDETILTFSPVNDTQKDLVKIVLEKERRLAEREKRRPKYSITEKVIPVLHVTTMLGDMIIEDVEDPYNGMTLFPIQRFCPYWFDGVIFGVVKGLKDPQIEINKRTSQMLHIINNTANSGWLDKDQGGATDKNALKEEGSKPGVIIRYTTVAPEKIKPNEFPQGLFILKQDEEANIKKVSGVNPDMLSEGNKTSDSGVAILRRQRQGATVSEPVYDNFRLTQRIFGKTIIEMIRHSNVYSPSEVFQIMQEEKQKVDINQLYKAMKSFAVGHYGYKIDAKPNMPTMRLANLEILMQLAQAGLPIPMDVIIEQSDIPNKDEIVQRIREEAQRAAQMQQQQGQGQQQRQPKPKGTPSPPKMQSNVKNI